MTRLRENGFSFLELFLALAIIITLIFVGRFAYQKVKNSKNPIGTITTTTNLCSSVGINDSNLTGPLTVTEPCNNQTIGRNFTISGIAPSASSSISESIAITIDTIWGYNPTAARNGTGSQVLATITPGQRFSIPVDLNGNKVGIQQTPVVGGENYTYEPIAAGKHIFTIQIETNGGVAQWVANGPNLNLTLNIK